MADRRSEHLDESVQSFAEVEVDNLQREMRDLRLQLEAAQTARRDLLSSTSWRITRPLRALKSRLMRDGAHNLTQEAFKVVVPAQLAHLAGAESPELSNETYRKLDVGNSVHSLQNMPRTAQNSTRIAFVGSQELALELEFDAQVTRVRESTWRSGVQAGQFDYLLLETVWNAACDDWRYSMVGGGEESTELRALLKHCRSIALPIVLWFREDPINYPRFAWLMPHVSRVYVVDDRLGDLVRKDHPTVHVATLPPAIQPALHNPVRSYALQESRESFREQVLFDGWWDAVADTELRDFLGGLRSSGLRVCESEWEFGGARVQDMPELAPYVLGCVDAASKDVLNKLIDVELFFPKSLRLPWRQQQAALRAAAAGALVGVVGEMNFGSAAGIAWSGAGEGLGHWLSSVRGSALGRAAAAHRMRRELLTKHCLVDRLNQIDRDLGLGVLQSETEPDVAMILVTMRPQLLASCVDRFRQDKYPNKELVVVLHGNHDLVAAQSLVQGDERIRFIQAGRERSLGACLNHAIETSRSEYWAKVDDDDLYGPFYLTDLMLGRRVCDFTVAGKPPMFTYLDASDELYFDPIWGAHADLWHAPPEARAALVAGATLAGKRSLLDRVRFSEKRRGGSDSDFIRRCYEDGFGVMSMDGFNFARYRSGEAGFHTWAMDERELRGRAIRLGGLDDVPGTVFV